MAKRNSIEVDSTEIARILNTCPRCEHIYDKELFDRMSLIDLRYMEDYGKDFISHRCELCHNNTDYGMFLPKMPSAAVFGEHLPIYQIEVTVFDSQGKCVRFEYVAKDVLEMMRGAII